MRNGNDALSSTISSFECQSNCRNGGTEREVYMEPKRVAIYTRVSTNDQHSDLQERELIDYAKRRGWRLYKIYSDKGVSGSAESRPALNQLRSDACKRYFDTVLVWKLDRYGRSLRHLVNGIA